ncbi:Acetylcholinesterase-1 [Araneus ventricosus]|uniref:Carboxylic ester hydrolase n=1 Tax=Araneus ventricosus TaxID=182803 RepID=A0A4Y2G9Q3_ARAVE|nr:Acetylcholinesterase-1 [Araneus ventricosus]
MKFAPLFLLALIFGDASSCYLDKLVGTHSGPVQGFLRDLNEDPVEVFLGIPFAEPPVGNLRFQKPKPVKPWTETLEATEMAPACIQYTPYPFPWADNLPGQSEDCLYLNIYAPTEAKNGSDLAVLFWIFGGGFTFGSNRMDSYDASALAVQGNVIVVTINYRLGVFGFVTSNTEDAPGNVGMHDIVMALQWVNNNIESFGGDKKRITLFGESAGSIAISLLCTSPLTKGLFSKAILQSGTGILLKSNQLEPNLALSQRLAEAVGCATEDKTIENDSESVVDCLRSKNATHLARVLWSFNPTSARSFFPQYGDDLLPNNFLDEIRKGNFQNVPLLIGNTRDEGSFQITTKQPELFGFFGQRNPIINKTHAENMIRGIFHSSDNPEKYVKHYLGNIPDDDYDAIKRQIYIASGDSSLLCETVYFAESYSERSNDVYFYFFTHRPSNTPWSPWMGVAHAEEVQFVFGRPVRKPYLYEHAEVELSKKMINVWTNFAKNGIPSDSFKWPKYSRENHTFVHIDTNFKGDNFGTGPHLENCNIMRDHFGF